MEFFVCLIGGALLVAAGASLFYLRPPDWQSDGDFAEGSLKVVARWASVQKVVRWINNSLIACIGLAIMFTAFVPHGRLKLWIWAGIALGLLGCIVFAMVDAISSVAGYRRALPEAARRSFESGSSEERS